jgi:hypothetical protein
LRAGRLDAFVVHLGVAAQRDVGQRADERDDVDQGRGLDIGQAALGQRDRVARQQRECAGPVDDVTERQAELGQRAEVTGTDRAAAMQLGQLVIVEQGNNRVSHFGGEPGASGRELVDPDQQSEPDHVLRVRRRTGRRMRGEQPGTVLRVGGEHIAVGADPGRPAVDRPVQSDLGHRC